MGGGYQIVELIILAMIAAFIALRLRSVLGKRTGHDRSQPSEGGPDNVHPLNDTANLDHAKNEFLSALEAFGNLSKTVRENLKRLNELEPGFDLNAFMEGSKSAYPMILEGFWAGKMDDIKVFLNETIFKKFQSAIKSREKKGLQVENRLMEIKESEIKDVQIKGGTAEITIEFKADIVSVTKDKDGKLVDGDLSDTVAVADIWTFARKIGTKDPNWTLVETEAG